MRPIVTDVLCKTAEPIDMPFGVWTRVIPKEPRTVYRQIHICLYV